MWKEAEKKYIWFHQVVIKFKIKQKVSNNQYTPGCIWRGQQKS